MPSWTDAMRVTVPCGKSGDWEISRFTVSKEDSGLDQLRALFGGHGRFCPPGKYTQIKCGGRIVMSDTPDEQRDHSEPFFEWRRSGYLNSSMLIAGLGIGMLLNAVIVDSPVHAIDVVEKSEDVLKLSGPHYLKLAEQHNKKLFLHHADIFEKKWPKGTKWNFAWFDIWNDLCEDNLEEMTALARSYARKVSDYKGFWGKSLLLRERRRTASAPWR